MRERPGDASVVRCPSVAVVSRYHVGRRVVVPMVRHAQKASDSVALSVGEQREATSSGFFAVVAPFDYTVMVLEVSPGRR